MGIFSWLVKTGQKHPATPEPPSRSSTVYVQVVYGDLAHEPRPEATHYTFRWKLSQAPQVGDRVVVPGMDGAAFATVVGLGRGAYRSETSEVIRLVEPVEIRQAHERRAQWLDAARRVAELPTAPGPRVAPPGQPKIPPATGTASADVAQEYGSAWWALSHEARDSEEEEAFKEIGRNWFALRDREAQERNVMRIRAEHPRTLIHGRHYAEYVSTVTELKREDQLAEALELLRLCQNATLAEDGGQPAPWWFEQEAIINRKLGRLEDEAAVLERYMVSADVPSTRLVERLDTARQKLTVKAAKKGRKDG